MHGNHDASTAKTYALIGLIFYGLATLGAFSRLLAGAWDFNPIFWIAPLWRGFGFLVSIGFTIWAYFTYKRIDERDYAGARTASLVLGILGLLPFIGSFLGGIFFLLAYAKLGNVLWPVQAQPYPVTPASVVTRFCVQCGRVVSPESHFCAYCGSELPE